MASPVSERGTGCGSGHSLLYLATHGRELWGFDLSPVQIAQAGLNIEALETPVDPATTKEEPIDPARWYSVSRAPMMPTTVIIKAKKRSGL